MWADAMVGASTASSEAATNETHSLRPTILPISGTSPFTCIRDGFPATVGSLHVAVVKHEVVSVGIDEERHMADARVQDLAGELHALGLELRAGLGHVVRVQGGMRVLLGRELHAETFGFPDAEARIARPDLELSAVVGPQAEHVHVEAAGALRVLRRDADEVELADHSPLCVLAFQFQRARTTRC